jgi:hypothetical protein
MTVTKDLSCGPILVAGDKLTNDRQPLRLVLWEETLRR